MPKCGAKTRLGKKCAQGGLENGRCRFHGGMSTGAPKGNKNALKHGIYASAISADEVTLWGEIEIGSVDDEIRIAKLQLFRAVNAQTKADESGEIEIESTYSLVSKDEKDAKKGSVATTRKRRPFEDIIHRMLGRVGDLEAKRAELLRNSPRDTDDTPTPVNIQVTVHDASKPVT